ncbi:hypothetical protein DSM104299_03862 [Baekduia alba]|uniref:DUF6084 family protein n=1 Tax=Baekduia alba TaxID=2997333 RepID=UPI002341C046|nr:DUF6084 family protein [Baekduia alba]WCB95120.1 hypothetical protein DSM104299_03862 [Baekduia alba]
MTVGAAQPVPDTAATDPVFSVLGVAPVANTLTPALRFDLHVSDPLGRPIHVLALTTAIRIDPARRAYDDATRARLVELFGAPERWAATTQALHWASVDVLVKGFTGATSFAVEVPYGYDLEVAATKYLYSLPDGVVPLTFLFTGLVLYAGEHDRLQVAQVPWSAMARWRMPLAAFRDALAAHHPGGGWVRLTTDTLDALAARKALRGDHSFDDTVRGLLG